MTKPITQHFSDCIATGLGLGLMPRAPGTFGTLLGIPIAVALVGHSGLFRAGVWLGIFVVGTWAAARYDRARKSSDNQSIVIDEVVGYGVTSFLSGGDPTSLAAAFVVFRIFDILKPPPVRQLDSWSKKQSGRIAWAGGFGVMIDDVAAGFQALGVLWLLQLNGWLP